MNSPAQLAPKPLAFDGEEAELTRTVWLQVSPPSGETTYEWSSMASSVYWRSTKPTWTKSPEASTQAKNWSDLTDSWLIFTGRVQVAPPSEELVYTISADPACQFDHTMC